MKTILLGYGDVNGKGKAVMLAGPEVPIADQVRMVTGIKSSGEYPKGIVRIEFAEVIARNTGVCVRAAAVQEKDRQAGEKERIEALKKQDKKSQAESEKSAARKKLEDAAIARNKIISELAVAKNKLALAVRSAETDATKENKAAAEAAQKLVHELEHKLASASEAVSVAEQKLQQIIVREKKK